MLKLKNTYKNYKSQLSLLLGLIMFLFLMVTAFVQNFIFLEKLIVCSLILLLIFFIKIMNDTSVVCKNSNDSNQNFKTLK
jgi:hypothetical protein